MVLKAVAKALSTMGPQVETKVNPYKKVEPENNESYDMIDRLLEKRDLLPSTRKAPTNAATPVATVAKTVVPPITATAAPITPAPVKPSVVPSIPVAPIASTPVKPIVPPTIPTAPTVSTPVKSTVPLREVPAPRAGSSLNHVFYLV